MAALSLHFRALPLLRCFGNSFPSAKNAAVACNRVYRPDRALAIVPEACRPAR